MKFGIAADRLDYHEAWISEHLGAWFPDTVAHADLLIANAAGLTRQIKLGLAVRLLPLFHPMDVAISAAMCDHLLRGRYLLGVGTGVPFLGNMERRGLTNEMRHAMMMESLDCILTCWTSPGPFDWSSEHWPGTGISVSPAPYRKPHPPIAVATSRPVVVRRRARLDPHGRPVRCARGDPGAGRCLCRGRPRRRREGRPEQGYRGSPCPRQRLCQEGPRRTAARRRAFARAVETARPRSLSRFSAGERPGRRRHLDQAFESGLFIGGDPDTVYHQLKDVYDRAGGFGTLLLVMGKDWGSPRSRRRSLELFMREVAPRLARLNANRARRAKPTSDAEIDDKTLTAAAY